MIEFRAVTAWLRHEGYSKALIAFNKATGANPSTNNNSMDNSCFIKPEFLFNLNNNQSNFDDEDSIPESQSSDNLSQSDILINMVGRPSVLKSVQEAIYEEMENRRLINHLINNGKTDEAVKKLEEYYPNLLSCNKQLALLLKIQQYIDMLLDISKVCFLKYVLVCCLNF